MVHPSQRRPGYSARSPSWSITFKRGAATRTFAVRPVIAGSAVGLFAIMLTAYVGATAYLVYRDDLLGAAVSRQVSMQYAYEERIAALRSELDRLTSRHVVQTEGVEQQVARLLDQQAMIESRQSALDRIVERARAAGLDIAVAEEPEEQGSSDGPAADSVGDEVKPLSYLPTGPAADDAITRLLEGPGGKVASLGGNFRPILADVRSSLDDAEAGLSSTVDALGEAASGEAQRLSEALTPIGIDVGGPEEEEDEPEGGPFIPASGLHFVEKAALLSRALDDIDSLRDAALVRPIGAPLRTGRVSSRFGYRLDPFLKRPAFHAGLDLVAPSGTTVYATAPGIVVSAGRSGGYGKMVEVKHADGVTTRYGHLSVILVAAGASVDASTPIGRVGSTGRSTGPHLHYETRRNGEAVNPTVYLAAGRALRRS